MVAEQVSLAPVTFVSPLVPVPSIVPLVLVPSIGPLVPVPSIGLEYVRHQARGTSGRCRRIFIVDAFYCSIAMHYRLHYCSFYVIY